MENQDAKGCPMMSRRGFLAGCGACAVGSGGLAGLLTAQEAAPAKPRIRLVFTHPPSNQPHWPYINFDHEGRKKELTEKLVQACPDVEFVPVTVKNTKEAGDVVRAADPVDGYLVYMTGIWTQAPRVIAGTKLPTLFVDDLYGGSGEFLIEYSAARRVNRPTVGVSSSRFEDVAAAARCFGMLKKPGVTAADFAAACLAKVRGAYKAPGDLFAPPDAVPVPDMAASLEKIRSSKMLVVSRYKEVARLAVNHLGYEEIRVPFGELNELHQKADRDEAARWAKKWIGGAEKMIEPNEAEVENSARMYLAMGGLMKKYGAQAITINCLGGFYGGDLKAYPCLGFCQFNDDGLVGACEADTQSTGTMLVMTALTGRPGYISDPVIDTSQNRIIYAHCVAPTKVFGPSGASSPYHIRSHAEDGKGATLRSLMPLGRMTTTLEISSKKKRILVHQARTAENVDEPRACRSKLAAEVIGDIDKLMTQWDQWGWHRVTYYGDLKPHVRALAGAVGFAVDEEA